MVVKYRAVVDGCVHCLLGQGRSFESMTGNPLLDELHARLGVVGAEPMFFERHGLSASQARAAFRDHLARVRARFPKRSQRARGAPEAPRLENVYLLDLDLKLDSERAAALLAMSPAVEYAEPLRPEQATGFVPDDPFFATSGSWGQSYADTWGLHDIGVSQAWDTTRGEGIVVAVLDTGVDYGHPDIAANIWTNPDETPGNGIDDDQNGFIDDFRGWDFENEDNDPYDRSGHGTHVAGTIVGLIDNGLGVPGVAGRARVMAVQMLDHKGGGRGFGARAILYAAENGADVINNSWISYSSSSYMKDVIATAYSLGVVQVAGAGNDHLSLRSRAVPAGRPQVIAVGAYEPDGDVAGFSNYGARLSVVAPGVDVLSLRGDSSPDVIKLDADFGRMSGTSTASPHVSGLAALLLSAIPDLTPDQVRWHIELNADQPGIPGYEGQLRNPSFGYGRIDAARIFDPPPITSRRTSSESVELNGFVGEVLPLALPINFHFTTLDPVAWTLSAPAWIQASATSGSGPAAITLGVDATAAQAGTVQGVATVAAPAAADGGVALELEVHLHSDQRLGDRFEVATSDRFYDPPPAVVSDGHGVLAAWTDCIAAALGTRSHQVCRVLGVRIDSSSTASEPAVLMGSGNPKFGPLLASDGRNALAVWTEFRGSERDHIMGIRMDPQGRALDVAPFLIEEIRDSNCVISAPTSLAFDGESWLLVTLSTNICSDTEKVYVRQISRDGAVARRSRLVYPRSGDPKIVLLYPKIACVDGSCLLVWVQFEGFFSGWARYNAQAIRLKNGERVASPVVQVLSDIWEIGGLASDGNGYMLYALRRDRIGDPSSADELIGARITSTGTSLDPAGFLVSNAPIRINGARTFGLEFDGESYVSLFGLWTSIAGHAGFYVFISRIAPDSTALDPGERLGLLVNGEGHALLPNLASAATYTVVAWGDNRVGEGLSTIMAQRMPAHTPTDLPELEIGAIGSQTVGENETLRFRVVASGLNPATTEFAASNLPPGAVFDSGSRLFQWKPVADESGSYPAVRFEATDGSQASAEDVSINVAERQLAVSGIVRLADGTPVPNVSLALKARKFKRTVRTDAQGRYRFWDVPSGRLRLKLTKPSSRAYRSEPRRLRLEASTTDLIVPDLTLNPR